jgi:hypothetical protein
VTEPAAAPRTMPGLAYLLALGVGTLGTFSVLGTVWLQAIPHALLPAAITTVLLLVLLGSLFLVVFRRISPGVVLVPVLAAGMIVVAVVGLIITITTNAFAGIIS